MKKILIIYPGFPHYRDGIIEALLESKNKQYIFIGDKNGYGKVKPYDFATSKTFHHCPAYKIGPFSFNKGLLTYILKNKVDGAIVHSNPYWISIILATFILRIKNVKVYNWTHGILTDIKNNKNKFYYYFNKICFDGLLLYSEKSRENLIDWGYPEEKVLVIYNSLNYKKQIELRDTLTIDKRTKIRESMFQNSNNYQLIFIGRLTVQKKLSFLIDAVRLLKDENILVNLLFVGDGTEKQNLISQIDKLEIQEQVYFYGASYKESTNYELIASSDICIAPGEIGLTAMHSLVYGVPVISHSDHNRQMPEFEAIKPNLNGALFENGNLIDLKEKIKQTIGLIETKSHSALKEDCFKIIDEYYNPTYQYNLIESLFGGDKNI